LNYIFVADSIGLSSTTMMYSALKAVEFSVILQNNGHYAIQGHSVSPILVPTESRCDFLLLINTNLRPVLHRFQVTADYWSNFALSTAGYLSLTGS